MFTQRDEELFILKQFRDVKGRFLDIGAHDGQCFSTTRALALKGWSGVCVEPSPSVYPALETRYADREDVITLPVAVTDVTGKVDFYDSGGDMISSVNKAHVKLWEEKGGCTFELIKVESLTVDDLFTYVGYDFKFISLDVEATNIEILQKFPFKKLIDVKMLCIEFDHQSEKVVEIVKPFGFNLLHRTAENLLLTR